MGSTGRVTYELRDTGPVLVKTLDYLFVDDKAGKPAGIHEFIGRRPIIAFGNSDGDRQMLEYTTIDNSKPSLGVLVHHTDGVREYKYDENPTSSGTLVAALRRAPAGMDGRQHGGRLEGDLRRGLTWASAPTSRRTLGAACGGTRRTTQRRCSCVESGVNFEEHLFDRRRTERAGLGQCCGR